jgi:hypothetical protein
MKMDMMDVTPKWRDIVPGLVEVAMDKGSSAEQRKAAIDELLHLADVVDTWIAKRKKAGLNLSLDISEEEVA